MQLPNEKSMLSASLSSNWTVGSTSTTTIPFNTSNDVKGSGFTLNSDGSITCNKAMRVIVIGKLFFSSLSTGLKQLRIQKVSGSTTSSDLYYFRISTEGQQTVVGSRLLSVSKDDTIKLSITTTDSTDTLQAQDYLCHLAVSEL